MVSFATEREGWLRQVIELLNGLLSNDTLKKVLQLVESQELGEILDNDGKQFLDNYKDKLINIDGKKIKGENPKS